MRPIVALLLAICFVPWTVTADAASAQLYFYCYVPDTASGAVYMSQPQPAGPVSERATYGAAYVAYLRSTGKLQGEAQGYCTMRGTEAEIARARARLSQEPCRECAGLTRFESVAWPRGGLAEHSDTPVIVSAPESAPVANDAVIGSAADELLIVVMGNTESGKLIKVSHQPDLLRRAEDQAHALRSSGWTTLLASRTPGFGAAVCVELDGKTQFFVAHGHSTQKEAVAEARGKAQAFAATNGGREKICGAPWNATAGIDFPREEGAIDIIRGVIEEEVTCDPNLPRVHSKAEAVERAELYGGSRPCVQTSKSGTGVRG